MLELGKLFNLSVLQFSHLANGENYIFTWSRVIMRPERVNIRDSAWDHAWHIIATSILLITGITISAISSVIQGEDVTALEKPVAMKMEGNILTGQRGI